MNEMDDIVKKPITIIADDFLNNIVDLINNSGLPYFIIESILKDCVDKVHMASQQQLKLDKKHYEQELKNHNH